MFNSGQYNASGADYNELGPLRMTGGTTATERAGGTVSQPR